MSSLRTPGAALVAAALLWGTTGTAASFFPDDVSPLAIGASTMTFGGMLLFALSARPALQAINNAASRRWLLLGGVGVVVYPLAFYSAMNLAGVAIGNVVSLGTGPIFAALLEWIFDGRRASRLWALCTSTALVGILLLALGSDHPAAPTTDDAGAQRLPGILLGLVAGLSYALYTYCSRRAIEAGASSTATMGGMFGVGAVALVPVVLALGAPLTQSASTVGIAAYLALGPMFIAYVLFGIAMRSLLSSTATTITLLEPVVATILAVVVVGERLLTVGWVGLALVLVPVLVLATARQTHLGARSP